MRRIIPLLFCMLLATTDPAFAQKKRNKNTALAVPTITVAEALKQYRFTEAIDLLNTEIENLELEGKDTEMAQQKLRSAEKGEKMMNAVEKVTFIDSLVVPRKEMFAHLKLSNEIGSISPCSNYFGTDTIMSSVYTTQMKDKIYYADIIDNERHFRLFSKDKEGNTWSEPSQLPGLEEQGDEHQNYPFMLSDGITLYYAAKGSESIGGYDIFMTRYDADEHTFLTPENIGMPFNSPANDYLYIVDDYYNLGWFVTDRNQKDGNVCIYTFIPNESRKVYNSTTLTQEKLSNLAKITSIKDTWEDKAQIDDALTKLQALKKDNSRKGTSTHKSLFIINDATVYNRASDFRSAEARKQYEFWLESQKELSTLESNLEKLRKQYAAKKTDEDVAKQIRTAESNLRKTLASIQQMEKQIRSLELNAL